MDPSDQRRLRENYVELVKNLNPEDVTDYLFQEHVLSEEDIENIQAEPTRAQRMRLFLSILPKKSKDGFSKFAVAMKQAGYVELAKMLETSSVEAVAVSDTQSPPGAPGMEDPKLMDLKEKLEQQSQVVTSMQAEMEALQTELKQQSQSFETNEKYKRTVTVLNELGKEKAERQRVYDEIYETLLKNMNKIEQEQDSKSSTRNSMLRTAGMPSFPLSGGIRHYAKIKCVLIGDGATGKSSIINFFIHKRMLEEYIPTVYDDRYLDVTLGNTLVTVNFWDTAGQEDFDRLRPLGYPDAHVAILVFSVESQMSLENVLVKWYPEIRHYCREVPVILVGNKTDTMNDEMYMHEMRRKRERFVESKKAHKAAEAIRAVTNRAFLCSARSGDGIQSILDCVLQVGLKNMLEMRRKTNHCACM